MVEPLGLVVLRVLSAHESLRAIGFLIQRVALRVDPVLLVEKLVVFSVFSLDVLPACASPATRHELNVRKALRSLGSAGPVGGFQLGLGLKQVGLESIAQTGPGSALSLAWDGLTGPSHRVTPREGVFARHIGRNTRE